MSDYFYVIHLLCHLFVNVAQALNISCKYIILSSITMLGTVIMTIISNQIQTFPYLQVESPKVEWQSFKADILLMIKGERLEMLSLSKINELRPLIK